MSYKQLKYIKHLRFNRPLKIYNNSTKCVNVSEKIDICKNNEEKSLSKVVKLIIVSK